MSSAWKAGDIVEVDYPFVRTTYNEYDERGETEAQSWRPGCAYDSAGDEVVAFADAMGKQILEVIDVHKPGRFPTRIFYTAKWVTPDGKAFGKNKLRITTVEAFGRRAKGFMAHDPFFQYGVEDRGHA